MKLGIIFFSFIVVTTLHYSCKGDLRDYYEVRSNNKVIEKNGIYEAKIYLLKKDEINTEIEPIFYIIFNERDTSYLPYDAENFCATYMGTGSEPGIRTWDGTLEYKTKSGESVKIEFSDSYTVK
jgi:hypothetical protein